MIRKIIYGVYAIMGMMTMTACGSRPDAYEISLEKMQGFPTEDAGFLKGVSALYAGVVDGNLLIAGGCNFPASRWREKSLLPGCIYSSSVK